jgi:protein-S-isoprenylcysteine O-methyltransferase Ste14
MADAHIATWVTALARKRVALGFLLGALVLWLAQPTSTSLIAGGVIGVAGESLRWWAAGHISKSREVTTSGPYRWLAHPLYVGSSIMGTGLAVATGSVAAGVVIAGYLALTIGAAVKTEEAFLRERFGDRYDRYRRGDSAGRGTPARRFSWAQAIANREYRTALGFLVVVLLLAAKATYNSPLANR